MENCFSQLRRMRRCDLAAEKWDDIFAWQEAVRSCLKSGLHCDVPEYVPDAKILKVADHGS